MGLGWRYFLAAFILLLTGLFFLPQLGKPSHDRLWLESYTHTPGAVVSTDTVTLKNVRDFNHDDNGTLSKTWHEEVTIQIKDVVAVWFGLARFEDSRYVGHSFLTFELTDGRVYTLSIEARREVGETYSALKGLFNNFELWYGWGTERDFLGVSLFTLDRPLEYYRLNLTPVEAQAVFTAVAKETSTVAATPQFYNTLTANCTDLLAKAVNRQYPSRLPYHPAWNLPGLAPQYLRNNALIATTTPLADLTAAASVNAADPTLRATTDQKPAAFSRALRQQLHQ